ncbi:DUF2203 domain-containing protein [Cohnella sp. AR92]|uniref:DUF2203 domain-containing protein n=1 Tax=Cohnella sp. AR92 TaxID=648716 RepID=UPI000F8DDF08|nr:DUF2203 domain-containing protein [Cohnella sp. AR92]RUS47493.1 DUF2203 family protein [Cohnella sp. AR92]
MTRQFTPEEANALLPELRSNLLQLKGILSEYEARYMDLQKLKASADLISAKGGSGAKYFEEESRLDFMSLEIDLLVENFKRHGVYLKMINPGLIDFPAEMGGREVLLCWKEGEERVAHYHSWEDGFRGRKPLPED